MVTTLPVFVFDRFRDTGGGFVVAAGEAGERGRYEESDVFDAADELVLPRLAAIAAGGREKLASN